MESNYKMSVIKDVTSLEALSKHDTLIRNHAKEFIRCNETAEGKIQRLKRN